MSMNGRVPSDKRICVVCHKEKTLSEFKSRAYKDRRHYNNTCLDCYHTKMNKYYEKNKHVWKAKWKENPEHHLMLMKKYFAKLKVETLTAYGGKCVCCGEKEFRFLTIEHSRHDGTEHRKRVGQQIYKDLRKRWYPKDEGITVLCWNCNMATRYGEECPHQKIKEGE